MTSLHHLPVPELAAAIRSGSVGAREAVTATLDRIAALDGTLNAVVALDVEGALAAADAVDAAVAARRTADLPPYAGVPTLVKDLNNVRGLPTTFGARSMADFAPPFDDHTVTRMRDAGFIVVGKTNTPEIGSLPVTEPLLHGPARNPWDLGRTPGGSSGGAAAAVAAGYVAVAHASDGGGSIRIPASNCGVVGLKPSRGRVSHAPLFGDQVMGYATQGSIGRRVVDAAALLDVMQGYATGDPYHLDPPLHPFVQEAGRQPPPARIGVVTEVPWASPTDDVQTALALAMARLERLGHVVEPMALRLGADVIDAFTDIWAASVAATPLPYEQLEPHNQAFADHGATLSAAELLQRFTSLQLVARSVVGACEAHDVVLAPVVMRPPLLVGELDGLPLDALVDLLAGYLGLTPVMNITGQPAIALPVHQTDQGLPIGVQLIGRAAGEAALLRLGAQLEEDCGWADRHADPPIDEAVVSAPAVMGTDR